MSRETAMVSPALPETARGLANDHEEVIDMAKATRREPARTATPDELAEENRRSEAARSAEAADLRRRFDDLDPDSDYLPNPASTEDRPDPINFLYARTHDDGNRRPPRGDVEGEPLVDLSSGHLRPRTWSQMADALQVVAEAVEQLVGQVGALEDARRPLVDLLANINRAAMAGQGRSAADIVEAYALETAARLEADRYHDEAQAVQVMYRFLSLYHDGRLDEARKLSWTWKLVALV